ncbi:hypothetical protein [Octadecabacter ascidiaceicola]|uniref:Uncharacterized protein n=1 Tax=Octadecabacter ascidiaceicola TaxID=1655543 RepID=A0A238K569_9RHOB|nr:hypothetical protein [Octadecabacter ascidiaceicola]SMX38061.1 hypothetical protein OCA8868_01660 [Octadecabacter ascidiaceicola]
MPTLFLPTMDPIFMQPAFAFTEFPNPHPMSAGDEQDCIKTSSRIGDTEC